MFNKSIITLKKTGLLVAAFLVLFSCKEDPVPLTFKGHTLVKNDHALVEINYPKAEGESAVAKNINQILENFLANEIHMGETRDKHLTLDKAIAGFDQDYKTFIEDFSDSTQAWEALIEAELTYDSETLVSIAINTYLDTGGAHGNSRVTFLNFDKQNGKRIDRDDLITDTAAFKTLAFPYFEKATQSLTDETTIEDPFYGAGFQLPETIGYGEEGLILLYNVYEIASYAQGVTEFTIPYDRARPYLKFH